MVSNITKEYLIEKLKIEYTKIISQLGSKCNDRSNC